MINDPDCTVYNWSAPAVASHRLESDDAAQKLDRVRYLAAKYKIIVSRGEVVPRIFFTFPIAFYGVLDYGGMERKVQRRVTKSRFSE